MNKITRVSDAAYYLNHAVATLSLATDRLSDELAGLKKEDPNYSLYCSLFKDRIGELYSPIFDGVLFALMDLRDAMLE